ncbi:MAG: HAD hydrolase-like protein [Patescibacteria group bacterium]
MERLLIFDFDGVLADTFELSYRIFKEQVPTLTKTEYRRWFDENLHTYLKRKKIELSMPKFYAKYAEALKNVRLASGWKSTLPALHKVFSMAIISSSDEDGINGYLLSNGIKPLFNQVWGVQKSASKVEKIQGLLEETGVTAENSWFVTDTRGDLEEVSSTGIKTIAFASGFHSRTRLKKGKPNKVVKTPVELSNFLLRTN